MERSARKCRLPCSTTMAQPARHREKGRKTLPSGGPENGLSAKAGKLYPPAVQKMGSAQKAGKLYPPAVQKMGSAHFRLIFRPCQLSRIGLLEPSGIGT